MHDDITDIFVRLLNECGTTDVAESEFKRMISDDDELRNRYNQWCHDNGSSFRKGFLDFCEEYLDNKNSIWESLTDYDE
ncbi:MAG: hypothetical protein J1E99_03265 [Muribaculaceae bacterium]|nr:hypothetical protein [Muribaculaceae bacterium]